MIDFKQMKDETPFLYWWKPGKKWKIIPRPLNVGDALSVYIVWHVMQEKKVSLCKKDNKLLAIGSIINHARDGDIIWGSGYNSVKPESSYQFSNLSVKAVRGPLTKCFLERRGILVPSVFGDPGLLASRYFSKAEEQDIDFLVVPHISENKNKFKAPYVLETKGSVVKFINTLVRAKKVISSSLHGIIIAESFGIPSILLKKCNGEGDEKYHDYYQGTGRNDFPICKSLEEALDVKPPALFDVKKIQSDLIDAFPSSL